MKESNTVNAVLMIIVMIAVVRSLEHVPSIVVVKGF